MAKGKLIIITGPTASGKTALAVRLAKHYNTAIVSADSRQLYKEISIGTAKPTIEEMNGVPHHFINSISIEDDYSVGQFEREAIELLEQLFNERKVVVMVGGTGLFIKAVCQGLDNIPPISDSNRKKVIQLFEEEGIGALQKIVNTIDADFKEMDNPQRLMRAVEVYWESRKPISAFQVNKGKERNFDFMTFAIEWERQELYNRINQRVDQMMEMGLEEEAKSVFSKRTLNALKTVGYNELFDFFDEKITLERAVELIKQNTRRYAKRQLTWLRKNEELIWVDNNIDKAVEQIIKRV